jgi:hypothetical protein
MSRRCFVADMGKERIGDGLFFVFFFSLALRAQP